MRRFGFILILSAKQVSELLGVTIAIDIKGIVEDVKCVENGYLFIARKGKNYDGLKDVDLAISKGAIVLHENKELQKGYYIYDLNQKIDAVLAAFYQNICDTICIVGVCGSNGKSSVVSFLYEMMEAEKCMCIGTQFVKIANKTIQTQNTTPSKIMLMHYIYKAKLNNLKYVFMEVSSHAISEERISLLRYDAIIYTNIARDHLDYHKTLAHYRHTKYKLVHYLKETGFVIANSDEMYCSYLQKICNKKIYTYGMNSAHFQISDVHLSLERTTFCINRFYYHTHVVSMVNVYNFASCIALLRMFDYSYFAIYKKILNIPCVKGRMEVVYNQKYCVIVDYAHTSKAFLESVTFLSSLKSNRLIVVVGCGGEREKEKREEIGYYASKYGDLCIFTEDNTRTEKIEEIIEAMCKNIQKDVVVIVDREKALEYAIKNAQNDDIILVSGKGDEQYLFRNNDVISFNDKVKILELVE